MASCSSRISRTVRATMTFPDRVKNAWISRRASLEKSKDTKKPLGRSVRHGRLECVDVRPAGLVLLLHLDRIPVVHEGQIPRGLGLPRPGFSAAAWTGKMRPSIPMSPTLVLLGTPPSAITAQFSNSNGGIFRSLSSVQGKPRTMKPRPAFQSVSSSRRRQTSPQPLGHNAAGGRRYVNADPLAALVFCGHERRPATAEGV